MSTKFLRAVGEEIPTYNLGFFLGPGLPRGLGVPASSFICPRLLLLPASEAPLRFFGPSPLEFSAASTPLGAGVDADSETLSLISGTFRVLTSWATGAGEEVADVEDCSSDLIRRSVKRRSSLGASFRTTILLLFLFLSARVEAGGDRVLEDDMALDSE